MILNQLLMDYMLLPPPPPNLYLVAAGYTCYLLTGTADMQTNPCGGRVQISRTLGPGMSLELISDKEATLTLG